MVRDQRFRDGLAERKFEIFLHESGVLRDYEASREMMRPPPLVKREQDSG